ncbi:MAG: methionine adenosyltransferase domain-containing protein [bacterium]
MQIAEALLRGEPNKVCDQIADGILDEYLRRDPNARLSIDVFCSHGALMIGGEVVSSADFDVSDLAKKIYAESGYFDDLEPFVNLDVKSPSPLKNDSVFCAAQVPFVGYATSSTPEMLPRLYSAAQSLVRRLDDLRQLDPEFSWLKPDGRVLVGGGGNQIKLVALNVQHSEEIEDTFLRTRLVERIVLPILHSVDGMNIFINQHGKQTEGGFQAVSAQNNRCLASDTYGGLVPCPNGALSGRDPLNPARLGAYAARFAAKNLVARGLGKTVMVRGVYLKGQELPVALTAQSGEGRDLTSELKKFSDFRISAVAERLDLKKPRYRHTAYYGHFGRDGFPWEKIER